MGFFKSRKVGRSDWKLYTNTYRQNGGGDRHDTDESQDSGEHDANLQRILNKTAISDIVATPTNAMSRARYAARPLGMA